MFRMKISANLSKLAALIEHLINHAQSRLLSSSPALVQICSRLSSFSPTQLLHYDTGVKTSNEIRLNGRVQLYPDIALYNRVAGFQKLRMKKLRGRKFSDNGDR